MPLMFQVFRKLHPAVAATGDDNFVVTCTFCGKRQTLAEARAVGEPVTTYECEDGRPLVRVHADSFEVLAEGMEVKVPGLDAN